MIKSSESVFFSDSIVSTGVSNQIKSISLDSTDEFSFNLENLRLKMKNDLKENESFCRFFNKFDLQIEYERNH